MRRRAFIAALGSMAAWPLVARAQQSMPIVGFLSSLSSSYTARFALPVREGLNESGYVEGQNLVIEYRSAEGQPDRLPGLVAELIDGKV
jgi:putative tryptophan/tyrosine transport system substrate-binding protein